MTGRQSPDQHGGIATVPEPYLTVTTINPVGRALISTEGLRLFFFVPAPTGMLATSAEP